MWVVACSWYAKEGRVIGERAVEIDGGEKRRLGCLEVVCCWVDVVGIWSRAMFVNVVSGKE